MARRLRLGSGLVLFAFLLTHYLNHMLGLVSLDAMERGAVLFAIVWRNPLGASLFYAALLLHMGLALRRLYRRRRLAMPLWEAVQLAFGLAIPPLLMLHLVGHRLPYQVFGTNDSYIFTLLIYFEFSPASGIRQAIVAVVAWVHAAIGLHFWLRLKPWYPPVVPYAFAAALLVPVIAGLGVLVAGRDVMRLAAEPGWIEATAAAMNFPNDEQVALVRRLDAVLTAAAVGLILAVFLARQLRDRWQRRHGVFVLTYPEGQRVSVVAGTTILEASRGAGIPHASVCGGRGRCSTCRVRIGRGLEALPPAAEAELKVLARVGATPNMRLACQTRPAADLDVTPLLPPAAPPRAAASRPGYLQGEEREVAILFADLRGFTTLSEDKLPYDVVFILNRYFAAMGQAIEECGGRVDKFIGDGIMALFGVEDDGARGCRQAVQAARVMAARLNEINAALHHDLPAPLRMGIGIHTGPVIVGEMGYGPATSVTAIGDAVNTASRLEQLTKQLAAQLVVSEPVAERAGIDLDAFPREEIELRGRGGRLAVRVVADARKLP